ncbi:hypothetical protein ABZ502_28500 [Streptomyces abikoensis]|uniref:hypothetical protein n=1 Tax=Streptomyces abikoensis TaxID=97398 RepID=UPI0033E1141B
MSDPQTVSPSPEPAPADPADAFQAEARREYAQQLAKAEMHSQAAKGGFTVPDGYAEFLDFSKLIREDGKPWAEAITQVLQPFRPKEPTFPQGLGLGRQGDSHNFPARSVSLDVRRR